MGRILAIVLSLSAVVSAAVRLPSIISDHGVLASSEATPIWGTASPGEAVTVTFATMQKTTTADANGAWRVDFDLRNTPAGPHTLTVNNLKVQDILVGEVWLGSGQSNMMLNMRDTTGVKEEAARCADSNFRYFYITIAPSKTPKPELTGKWVIVSPETIYSMTGVGYYFAKALRRELKRPVGLLHASRGATSIVSWMSWENLQEFPYLVQQNESNERWAAEYPKKLKAYMDGQLVWEKKFHRDNPPDKALPEKWENGNFSAMKTMDAGIIWRRVSLPITDEIRKKGLFIELGQQSAMVSLWLDGKRVYANSREQAMANKNADARFPASYFANRQGNVDIAIRYFNSGKPKRHGAMLQVNKVDIGHKDCLISKELILEMPTGHCLAEMPKYPGDAPWVDYFANRLYNGMIHPLPPYRLSGVIWYQGEADRDTPDLYRKVFISMIKAWRKHFNQPELPFFFCQLAAYQPKTADPANAGLARIRDAQAAALALPNTGMAVLTDCGETEDIHPRDKVTPGERLAALALNRVYGKTRPDVGPSVATAACEGSSVRLTFKDLFGGLAAHPVPEKQTLRSALNKYAPLVRNSPNTQLEGFALRDANGRWFWADKAVIENDTVLISSTNVKTPTAIRYNWTSNPSGNLFNKAGFPMPPTEITLNK